MRGRLSFIPGGTFPAACGTRGQPNFRRGPLPSRKWPRQVGGRLGGRKLRGLPEGAQGIQEAVAAARRARNFRARGWLSIGGPERERATWSADYAEGRAGKRPAGTDAQNQRRTKAFDLSGSRRRFC